MEQYLITEKQLDEIVRFAMENPDTIFSTEPMNDGAPFLSCTFFNRDGDDGNAGTLASGFWELSKGRE